MSLLFESSFYVFVPVSYLQLLNRGRSYIHKITIKLFELNDSYIQQCFKNSLIEIIWINADGTIKKDLKKQFLFPSLLSVHLFLSCLAFFFQMTNCNRSLDSFTIFANMLMNYGFI